MRPCLALCCFCLASRTLDQHLMGSDRNEGAAAASCEVSAAAGRNSVPWIGALDDRTDRRLVGQFSFLMVPSRDPATGPAPVADGGESSGSMSSPTSGLIG